MDTRQTILASVAILVVIVIGAWWYLGFTLDFMRFFAVEPGLVDCISQGKQRGGEGFPTGGRLCCSGLVEEPVKMLTTGEQEAAAPTYCVPPGCYMQQVQCIQAPCDPVIVCPSPTTSCVPRPACMDADPPCMPDLAPGAVLCPPSGVIVECLPAQQTVKVGDAAHLSAQGGNGAYEWYSPEGGRVGGIIIGADGPITNTYSVMYNKAGTKKVTVESPRGDGSANVDSVACTVIVEPSLPQ